TTRIEQTSLSVGDVGGNVEQLAARHVPQLSHTFHAAPRRTRSFRVQEVAAVREEVGVAVSHDEPGAAGNYGLRSGLRCSAVGSDLVQRTADVGSKHDRTVASPAAAAAVCGRCQIANGAALDVDTFEMAPGEEAETASVRRPE